MNGPRALLPAAVLLVAGAAGCLAGPGGEDPCPDGCPDPACPGAGCPPQAVEMAIEGCRHDFYAFSAAVQDLGQPGNVTPEQQVPGVLHVAVDLYSCRRVESPDGPLSDVDLALLVIPIEDPGLGDAYGQPTFTYVLEAYSDSPVLVALLRDRGFPARNATFSLEETALTLQEGLAAEGTSYQLATALTPEIGTVPDNLYRHHVLDGAAWSWLDVFGTESVRNAQPCSGMFEGSILQRAYAGAPAMPCYAGVQAMDEGVLRLEPAGP